MSLRMILTVVSICGFCFLRTVSEGQAGELILHDGGAVSVKNGSTLLLNCNNLTIENGGIFTVDGGVVAKRGKLIREAGGQYVIDSGKAEKCYKAFYVIPGMEGKGAVICL